MFIGVSTPSKTSPLFEALSLDLKTVQPPLFLVTLPHTLVFHESPSLKIGFFSEPSQYSNFLFLTPSHLLKVTKTSVKISQFELLVMIEENIFLYKLINLLLNILDFSLFFM